MSSIVALPRELLLLIANYLLPKDQQNKLIFRYSYDWRNFLNASKEYFSERKKQTQLLVLDSEYTLKFIRSAGFSHRISQLMEDSRYRLVLKVNGVSFLDEELRFIERVKCFSACHGCLNSSLKLFSDISSYCITDVSCYRNIQNLYFAFCPNITDVSCLRDVHKLSFRHCQGITDASSLERVYMGNVHILNLDSLARIMAVSSLKNVYELHLELKDVYELHLEWFKGHSLTGLENVKKRFVNYSTAISNISTFHVAFCPLITDFHGLKNLRILEISYRYEAADQFKITSGLEIFENLVELRTRWVHFFDGKRDLDRNECFLSLSDVPNAQNLSLEFRTFTHFLERTHLLSLKLMGSLFSRISIFRLSGNTYFQ
jgi:hypothetical protein